MSVDVSQDRLPDRNQTPASCVGCQELELRVARLERALADSSQSVETKLGTTMCYWVCVGAHAMFGFVAWCLPGFIGYSLPIFIGFIATLSISHVMSTRPIGHRSLRTVLSVAVVMVSISAGIYVAEGGDIEVADLFPMVLLFVPPAVACCWLIAKLFVWIVGWRIVAPSGSMNHPKLLIRHILVSTLLVAGVFAIGRGLEIDSESVGGETVYLLFYVCLPAAFCTCTGCFLVRSIFTKSGNQLVVSLIVVGLASIALVAGSTAILLAYFGELEADTFKAFAAYSFPMLAGVWLSIGGTFGMMRMAGYEFNSNRLLRKAASKEAICIIESTAS